MNTPYLKQYNELGELINRLDGGLRHKFPNRRARRAKPARDFNNKKSFPTVVVGNQRFRKRLQFIESKQDWDKSNGCWKVYPSKTVIHYDEAK